MTDSVGSQDAEFDGECALSVSLGKIGIPGDPQHEMIQDGRRYRFKNPVARFLWRVLPDRRAKAVAAWRASKSS